MRDEDSGGSLPPDGRSSDSWKIPASEKNRHDIDGLGQANMTNQLTPENVDTSNGMPFELYKRLTTVVVSRELFLDIVCDALTLYKYVSPHQRTDLLLACRLGVTTVVSTDSIRHMMRSYVDEEQNPLLWASTYHAGECLDPVAVAEAKDKRKAKKLAIVSHTVVVKGEASDGTLNVKPDGRSHDVVLGTELIGKKQMAIEGFKAQSEMVIDSLDRLITAWEERKESVVVEGVHLSLNFVLIQSKGSSRHLMALLNTDGSIAKAWPFETVDYDGKLDRNGNEKFVGNPMYGPLQIGKVEPVNLQFGNFGISAWPNDTCGTSQTGSIDDSRAEGTDTGSRYFSSCCSSPKALDGPAKEVRIVEGSVDEDSTKSDEEYEDLAMRDDLGNGYWSNDDESANTKKAADDGSPTDEGDGSTAEKYRHNLELLLKMSEGIVEPPFTYALLHGQSETNTGTGGRRRSLRFRDRAQSIPAVRELRAL
ncbi:hypothetical protein BHE74_00009879 [Ensete ventricosum]|nr:hypothetical protein BHE74_00009879 [Ensete ventricosum]